MTDAGERQIDWSTAEIRDAILTVKLAGEAPKGWSKHFDAVLRLLDRGSSAWGQVRLTKNAIEVTEVQEGSERDLRHLLESIVLQVNSELRPEAEDTSEPEGDQRRASDERMLERFRDFAEPDA